MTSSPLSPAAQEKKERIETAVMLTKNGRPRSLRERTADYAIPGVSIAIINDYALEWACGYGVRKKGEAEPVDTETLFQACSISKAVTAIAVLRLVEDGRLDLNADVNAFLKTWKVPANGSWQPEITVRQVLSHTAGVHVPWFAGYHRDQDIPTLLEILDGEQPANNLDIRVTTMPGVRFRYSGGGYIILQQLLMDVMKKPFPDLMRELVLDPLGMGHSTYEPSQQAKIVAGHRKSGRPVAGDWYIYPELAAAGLWTTPSDLARFALALQCAQAEKPHQLLSTQMVQNLLTPQSHGDERGDMGLGIFVQGVGPDARFGHPGDNAGFTSCWVSLIHGGQGCILMTNSDNGWPLQQELLRTIEQVYAWPELSPHRDHEREALESAATASDPYVGEYELQPDLSLTINRIDDHLFLQITGQELLQLERHRDGVYGLAHLDDTITFVRNGQGRVQGLLLRQGGTETLALKRGAASR